MSVCSDLINAINAAVVDPNLLASIAASDLAVLSDIGTTESIVQLAAGGDALLSMPASPDMEGNLFRVCIAGHVFNARSTTTQVTLRAHVGTSIGTYSLIAASSFYIDHDYQYGVPYGVFSFDLTATWSSTMYRVDLPLNTSAVGRYWFLLGNATATPTSVMLRDIESQTDLKFFLTAQFTSADSGNAVTVSQMTLKKV